LPEAAAISIEDEEGIMFTGEIKDERPVVKGGSVEKLVERLTFPAYAGKSPTITTTTTIIIKCMVLITYDCTPCVEQISNS
jgi:hypothetical protein